MLIAVKALLVLCFFNQVIYDILVELKFVKFILLKVDRDRFVITIIIVK